MNCSVCPEKIVSKYKCPKCRIPYCSLACWKNHKAEDCVPEVKPPAVVNDKQSNLYYFPTEDTVPLEKLQLLEQNQELKNILCNRHLRDMLVAIDKSVNPAAAMQQAMLEPIFVEFTDECLKIVEPAEESSQ
ncbi:zinc finger HIT domain-containing protein 3 [Macrosteles quadrilineatus]|uniref:zinc finger HIT domain-containing protein 3 n=1 Tax=Macrosteles quadrilineatus TaxID=74068 RepID=UPI0023E13CF1|nr:zinc finger HIT domain-containing protein 3 [Macrosteles quadrilineatus]